MALLARSAVNGVLARPCQRISVALRKAGPARRFAAPAYKNDSTPALDTEEVNKKLNEALTNTGSFLQNKWEETEDKPAAVLITAGAILLLITLSGVVDAVDKIPIVSDLIELVGVFVTGWFTYRYLVFGPDREELVSNIKVFLSKVYGK